METKKQTKRKKRKTRGKKNINRKKNKRENQTIFREGMKHETIQLL